MGGNTNNAGIPTTTLRVGDLVSLTTGSTLNGQTYAYPLYSGYTCTQLVARAANATVTLKRTELQSGNNIILPIGNVIGNIIDYAFDGHDIVGWTVGAVYAMCYACSDCFPASGSTIGFYGNRQEIIGGTAFKYVTETLGGANQLPI